MTILVTPGSDAVLREWVYRIHEAARNPKMGGSGTLAAEIRSLCEAVAAAERERIAYWVEPECVPGCGHADCRVKFDAASWIRSLTGLPEIGRPGK